MSIIVLFLAGSPWVERCLRSLRAHVPGALPHEVIVLGNGAGASPEAALTPAAASTRLLQTQANLGFGGGCNWAARHARGEYLVLLNDDAVVSPGWLAGLLEVAREEPRAGAVGSLVVRPGGRVEECGRVLWSDGTSHGMAAGSRPAAVDPDPRVVDCCSACSLLVRREAWDQVGGFDERFFPAYYEDVDLCLELRRYGWAVLAAPGSRVMHHGGASTAMLWKRFLGLRNHRAFVEKWGPVLELQPPRPRDAPTRREVAAAASGAGDRARRAYHLPTMPTPTASGRDPGDEEPGGRELLEEEVRHLQAELRIKDEYIAELTAPGPAMQRALERVLAAERRRARLREVVLRTPVVGGAARRVAARRRDGGTGG